MRDPMSFLNKLASFVILPLVFTVSFATICYANASPPAAIFVTVRNAPKSLVLTMDPFEVYRKDKIFETRFSFVQGGTGPKPPDLVLQVANLDDKYQITLPKVTAYEASFVLDLNTKTLTPGEPWLGAYEFLMATILLTLALEGLIFFIFGYRKKISWLIFLLTNLVTQGVLYLILILPLYIPSQNYRTWHLFWGEFCVFVIEMTVFTVALKERPRIENFLYAILANLFSFVLGFAVVDFLR